MIQFTRCIVAAATLAAFSLAPIYSASAQQAGTTSGPAAGTNVQPSNAQSGKNGQQSSNEHTGAGAPGVKAKAGSESGPAPQPK